MLIYSLFPIFWISQMFNNEEFIIFNEKTFILKRTKNVSTQGKTTK